jgi:hypothetical protein
MKTLDLKAAAAMLKMHPESLRRKARAGEIPAAKPGVRWVFLEADLADYLRGLYARSGRASRDAEEETPCDTDIPDAKSFINATQKGTGSCSSPPRTAAECIARLRRGIPRKPRSTSTTAGPESGE